MRLPPLIDLHQDISYYYVSNASGLSFPVADFSKDLHSRHADIPKYKKAKAAVVFASVFGLAQTLAPEVSKRLATGYSTPGYERAYTLRGVPSLALEHIKVYNVLEAQFPEALKVVRSENDLRGAVGLQFTGLLLSLEGAYAIEDVYDLKLFYQLGLRSLGLSWNFDSRYNASCMSERDYGLTGAGMELVQECNRLGVIIDLAHASRETHLAVTKASRLPVINSHSNVREVYEMARNLDDEMYEAVGRNGGVVGTVFSETMTGGGKDVLQLAKHIMYVREHHGPDILAIGSDYFGLIDYPAVRGLEDIRKIGTLYRALSERGMSEEELEKMAYKNALRVILENTRRWR